MKSSIPRADATTVGRRVAALSFIAAGLLGGCGSSRTNNDGSSGSLAAATVTAPAGRPTPVTLADASAPTATTDAATASDVDVTALSSPAPAAAGNADGSPIDPCALLSPTIAAAAIGVPVGDPNRLTDQGNASCSYHSADSSTNRFVYLTTYAVLGSPAILAAAAATFHDAQPVSGLGDAAEISVQSQAVGVLVGTTVFAVGVAQQNADGSLQLLTTDQLVAVARAVLEGQS